MMAEIVIAEPSKRIRAPTAILAFQTVDIFLRKLIEGILGVEEGSETGSEESFKLYLVRNNSKYHGAIIENNRKTRMCLHTTR